MFELLSSMLLGVATLDFLIYFLLGNDTNRFEHWAVAELFSTGIRICPEAFLLGQAFKKQHTRLESFENHEVF